MTGMQQVKTPIGEDDLLALRLETRQDGSKLGSWLDLVCGTHGAVNSRKVPSSGFRILNLHRSGIGNPKLGNPKLGTRNISLPHLLPESLRNSFGTLFDFFFTVPFQHNSN